MNCLITICARGGSKGIPGKNIKKIGEKPLIGYTIEHAIQFKSYLPNTDIFLSTDSEEIKDVTSRISSEVDLEYMRPNELATDSAGKIGAISDLLNFAENKSNKTYDYVLDLDVTSPLRNLNDLKEALEIIIHNEVAMNLFSVNVAAKNPYFNMVEMDENGFYSLSKKGQFLSRQSAPKVYELNASFYFYKRAFFNENLESAITARSLIYEMKHICFDLDQPLDFELLNYLLVENKLDFDF